ncbi:uncharacterized protein LOC121269479 isoform X7 [Carcharodon carcharias]|uniref:uncharacterized protein LOC121269479 isoform X7 n=1 Tax=Carcharodon carcharias TaxID=13397 RepID=UPI001B7EB9FB|nr:uncharacterized protein LOC121269479 isoform X7 [Carcharodon carcharias]
MRCHVQLIIVTIVTILLFGPSHAIVIKEEANGITLECPRAKHWEKDGMMYEKLTDNGNIKLAKLSDSDTGEYSCTDDHQRSSAYVFIKLSEKQSLVPHDHNDVYQHLGNRRGSCEYSQLTPRLKV